jgi:hypothetical protein
MNRKPRSRKARNALCLAALAGLVFAAPGAALAGHDKHEDRRHKRVHRNVPVYRHGDACNRNVRASYDSHRRHQAVYTCGPCSHRFDSRRAFHRHLRHQHHVAPWVLPFVIVHHTLGWIFYG